MVSSLENDKWKMINDGNLRVAIVHDWLIGGGAELVVLELHKMFPDAPIFTSYCSPEWRSKLDGRVVTGFLQKWPFSKLRKFLPPLRIWWFSRLNLKGFDLVISSSGAEAKGIRVPKGTPHIAYIHAPTHYYWSRYEQYLRAPGFGKFDWLARLGLKALIAPLKKWDFKAAQRPEYLIANSTHTQTETKKYYGRKSVVVHPPVDIEKFSEFSKPSYVRRGFVITGRQTPYKRIDLAVEACTKLDLPLIVIGDGPEYNKLVRMAGPSITFTGHLASSRSIARKVGSAMAFIFPGVDDFGISAVEALAAGTPVIAFKGGGAIDYVNDKTGVFFEEQTVDSLMEGLSYFNPRKYIPHDIKKYSKQFSKDNFRESIAAEIQKVLR